MRRNWAYLALPLLLLLCQTGTRAQAQGIVVPAGTLLKCTLNEPNLSSATAEIGDPVLCQLASLQEFGETVFPRGSYLQGHLEADKEAGHFFGKGYLKLQFDRIGMPDTDMPLPSKIIAAKGYRVDREGDIVGHGHAKRDTAEWLFPPLWPWKVVSLPARGPRPTLKGEEAISIRLMEDIVVPRRSSTLGPGWHSFGQPSSFSPTPAPAKSTALLARVGSKPATEAQSVPLTRIALKSHEMFDVTNYRMENNHINYVLPNGQTGAVDVRDVDWRMTSQLNTARQKVPVLEASWSD
jgi:hypothetical protein